MSTTGDEAADSGTAIDDWSRRLLATFGIVALAHVLQFVPFPWLQLHEWYVPNTLGGWFIVGRDSSPLSVAGLGFVPFTTGLGLTTIVFALVPKLARSLGEPEGETRLLRVGLWVTTPLATLQSTGVGLYLHGVSLTEPVQEVNPWLVGSTLALFATMFGALPFALERWGLGRGLAAAALLYCLSKLAEALHAMAFDWLVVRQSPVHVIDLALVGALVIATLGATRRWVGDAPLLPGEPRFDRIGRGLAMALIGFAALNLLGLQRVAQWASIGQLGLQVLSLAIAVGGGLLIASRQAVDEAHRLPGGQLLALGTFVLFAASLTAMLTTGRVVMPWAECVVATILLYTTYRSARAQLASSDSKPTQAR